MLYSSMTPTYEIEKSIRQHFNASNALEHAMCHLRVCGFPETAQRELEMLNVEIAARLTDLITERNYREAKARRAA